MQVSTLFLTINLTGWSVGADTARRTADTVFIEPPGVRLTIPSLWMGRVPPGAKPTVPGRGRFGCQLMISGPVEDRIVLDPNRFLTIQEGIFGERRAYQDALDAIFPASIMVAHLGGDRFNNSCLAPQVHIYVADSATVHPADFGPAAEPVIERAYSRVRRVESDSAGWHVVRISWTESKTDFIHPATLEIWARVVGSRMLILGIMDSWAARGDVAELLASIR